MTFTEAMKTAMAILYSVMYNRLKLSNSERNADPNDEDETYCDSVTTVISTCVFPNGVRALNDAVNN